MEKKSPSHILKQQRPPRNPVLPVSLQHNNCLLAFEPRKYYGAVKFLGMSVMLHIARTNPDIIVNACCPFLCKTELVRNSNVVFKVVMAAMQYFTARSAEEGARMLVSATALGEESQGGFWTHDVLARWGKLQEMGRR
jgi:hypothetical protein